MKMNNLKIPRHFSGSFKQAIRLDFFPVLWLHHRCLNL